MNKQDKIFYTTALKLMLDDYKKGKMEFILEEAYRLYEVWGIKTIIKNGKIDFEVE